MGTKPAKNWPGKRRRFGCGSSNGKNAVRTAWEEQGVVTAPAQIVPKSKLSNEFVIEVLAQKCQQHLPVYRQCATLAENHQLELSCKTLADAVLAAGGLLQAVVRAQAAELVAGGCRRMKRLCPVRRRRKLATIIGRTSGSTACRGGGGV